MEQREGYQFEQSPELEALFAEAQLILANARERMESAIEWANGELAKHGLGPMTIVFNVRYPSIEELAGAVTTADAISKAAEAGDFEALGELSPEAMSGFGKTVEALVASGANIVAKQVEAPEPGDPDA